MNNDRRKTIHALIDRIKDLDAERDEIMSEVDTVRDEEQEYLDNMPESLQSSERGENAQAAIDALGEAATALEDLNFDDATSALETASE